MRRMKVHRARGGDPLVLFRKVRSPEHLMVLAAEFTALANALIYGSPIKWMKHGTAVCAKTCAKPLGAWRMFERA